MMRGTKSGIKSSDYRSAAADESSRIRSRTSQRLQSAGGVLLPSPLKANRVSSALGGTHQQQHNSSSHSGGSPKSTDEDHHHLHSPKSPSSRAASGDLPVGHKRVTRSSTTTKRYFYSSFSSFNKTVDALIFIRDLLLIILPEPTLGDLIPISLAPITKLPLESLIIELN